MYWNRGRACCHGLAVMGFKIVVVFVIFVFLDNPKLTFSLLRFLFLLRFHPTRTSSQRGFLVFLFSFSQTDASKLNFRWCTQDIYKCMVVTTIF